MRLLRGLAIGCVGVAGLALAFAAGVWVNRKPEPIVATNPPPTTAKPTPATQKADDSLPPSRKPSPTVRPANDPPKMDPLPAVKQAAPLPVPTFVEKASPAPLGHPPEPRVVIGDPIPSVPPPVAPLPTVAPDLIPQKIEPITPVGNVTGPSGVTPIALPSPPKAWEPPVQYVSRPDVEFDYDIGKKGKSGVRFVMLFVRDSKAAKSNPDAKPADRPKGGFLPPTGNWRMDESEEVKGDPASKLRYVLPREGRYEFRLGVTGGTGNSSVPTEADTPDLVVVFDTTPPTIKAFDVKVDSVNQVAQLSFEAADANPDDSPPVYEYRTTPTGTWLAAKVEGRAWKVPDDAPAEVAVRITVRDKAGNVATKVIDKVNLDTTVPDGKLTRVRVVQPKQEMKMDEPAIPPVDPVRLVPKITDEKK